MIKARTILILGILIFKLLILNGQSNILIDSLKENKENQILILDDLCVGCLVMNPPCPEYYPSDKYVIWFNKKGFYIKKFNDCGQSETYHSKKWKRNPFDIIANKKEEFDTSTIKPFVSYDSDSEEWFEVNINHYQYYLLSHQEKTIEIREYAYAEFNKKGMPEYLESAEIWLDIKKGSEKYKKLEEEYIRNMNSYNYNNNNVIKKVLDAILKKINNSKTISSLLIENK